MSDSLPPDVARRAEQVADVLLRRADLPVGSAAADIARRLGHTIEWVKGLEASAKMDPITCAILLSPCDYAPRAELTIAHELIEHYTPARIDPRWHEAFCQRGAAALLMPQHAFVESAVALNLRLPELAARWARCSKEAILTRMSDLFPNTVASSWRHGRPKFRRPHSGFTPPAHARELEEFVAAEATYQRRESWLQQGRVAVRAWPASDGRALSLTVAA